MKSRKQACIILIPLNPTFILRNWGFQGVHYFSCFAKNIDSGYTLEAVLTSTHNLRFQQEYEKYQNSSENFPFLVVKFSIYLNMCVFVMKS